MALIFCKNLIFLKIWTLSIFKPGKFEGEKHSLNLSYKKKFISENIF